MLMVFVVLWILFAVWVVSRNSGTPAERYWRALDENRNPWK